MACPGEYPVGFEGTWPFSRFVLDFHPCFSPSVFTCLTVVSGLTSALLLPAPFHHYQKWLSLKLPSIMSAGIYSLPALPYAYDVR